MITVFHHCRDYVTRPRRARRRGATVVLLAVVLVIMILSAVWLLDSRFMRLTEVELQTAANAAGHAASRTYAQTHSLELARASAKNVAQANRVNDDPLILIDEDIRFGRSTLGENDALVFTELAEPINTVQISARRTRDSASGAVPLSIGRVIGLPTFEPVYLCSTLQLDREICLVIDGRQPEGFPNPCAVSTFNDEYHRVIEESVEILIKTLDATPQKEQLSLVAFDRPDSSQPTVAKVWQPLTKRYADVQVAVRELPFVKLTGGSQYI